MSFYSHDYVKCANCATLRPFDAMDSATHRVCADATWCDEVKRGVRLPTGPRPIETFAEIFEVVRSGGDFVARETLLPPIVARAPKKFMKRTRRARR